MSLSPRKKDQLSAFLGALPDATALKLFAALEADRAAGGKGLPHTDIIADLRQKLLERGATLPVRRVDSKRLFYTPFEDYFVNEHHHKKLRARLARTSLNPIWRVMMTDRALGDAALAAASLDDALADGGDTEPLLHALFLASEAGLGRLCDAAAEDAVARDQLIESLGGDDAFADLEELRHMIAGVEYLYDLRKIVPDGAPSLTDQQMYDLRSLFLSAYGQSRSLGADLLLALKGRLEKPWRALSVYYHLAQTADEQLRAAQDVVSILPESLFEDIETTVRALERDGAGQLNAKAALLRASYFADYADGLARQSAKIGDNVFLNRIEASRDVGAEAFERFAEQALTAMRAAMPVRTSAGSSRLAASRPDIAMPLNARVVNEAVDAALLIEKAPELTERLTADPTFVRSIATEASDHIHSYAKDLVVEIRASEGDERKAARRLLENILTIAAPLLDRDEIGLIRDRAAAAAVAV